MGMLVDGKWSTEWYKPNEKGQFVRSTTSFRNQLSADGSSGFKAEAGRYHLYLSMACPWAHRTLIMRKLKGLEEAITISVVDSYMGDDGWAFSSNPGCIPDSVNSCDFMREVYLKADPKFTGRVTVPVLWDKEKKTIVNNESKEVMRILDTEFGKIAKKSENYYPQKLRNNIDEAIDKIYNPINNGVYRTGFATTQEAYNEAVTELFAALDYWDDHLSKNRYLCGDVITEADWCFFTTLIRFDLVYYTHFKCNVKHIYEYESIWNYLKELYQLPGISETCNFQHIKDHYFKSHPSVNPHGIVPAGPIVDFNEAHNRGA